MEAHLAKRPRVALSAGGYGDGDCGVERLAYTAAELCAARAAAAARAGAALSAARAVPRAARGGIGVANIEVEVRETAYAGNGLFLNKPARAGELVVVDGPPLAALVFLPDQGGAASENEEEEHDAGGAGGSGIGGGGGSSISAQGMSAPAGGSYEGLDSHPGVDSGSGCESEEGAYEDGAQAHPREVCAHCFNFVGGAAAAAARRLTELREGAVEGAERVISDCSEPSLLESLSTLEAHLVDGACARTGVRCACGVVYRGASCAEAAAAQHHALLCTSDGVEGTNGGGGGGGAAEGASNALALADSIAVATNESLALAGQALARVAMRAAWELRQARENSATHTPMVEEHERALRAAWLPYAAVYSLPWWEVLPLSDAECIRARECAQDYVSVLRAGVRRRVEQGWTLRVTRRSVSEATGRDGGGANTPAEPIASNTLRLPWAELRELWPTLETRVFTTEAIGYLMGAFELNNLRLTVADPLGAHIDALDAVEEGETAAREASAHEQPVEAAMRVLARERAPERRPALGSALYALHSQVNHSCEPNVEAVPERRRGEPTGAAVLYALRDIEAGEELLVSYIDEDAPLQERRAALSEYGFQCACPKCRREDAAAATAAGGVKGKRKAA